MLEKSSIGFSGLKKVTIFVEIPKFSKNSKILKNLREALLLYELSEREQVDGSPLVAIEQRSSLESNTEPR